MLVIAFMYFVNTLDVCIKHCSQMFPKLKVLLFCFGALYIWKKLLTIEQEIRPSKHNNNSCYIFLPGENLSGGLTRVPVWDRVMIRYSSVSSGSWSGTTWRWERFFCSLPVEVSTRYDRGLLTWATTLPFWGLFPACIHTAVSSGISGISLVR